MHIQRTLAGSTVIDTPMDCSISDMNWAWMKTYKPSVILTKTAL